MGRLPSELKKVVVCKKARSILATIQHTVMFTLDALVKVISAGNRNGALPFRSRTNMTDCVELVFV